MHDNVAAALAEAEKLVAALKAFDGTPGGHLGLLQRSDAVLRALEEPYDITSRFLENLTCSAALANLICIGALQKLPVDGSSISAVDLATAANVDISAITRSFRLLLVNGIAVETAPDTYAHNALSRAFVPEALGGVVVTTIDLMRSWIRYPDYLKSHAPQDLWDLKKSPFAYAFDKEGETYYDVINLDPWKRELWNTAIREMEKNMPVLGMFPFDSLKEQVAKEPERPFIVDVGGGLGQAMKRIETQCPNFFGAKVVLQDLPIVIDSIKKEDVPGIEPMAHDVFSGPNPVKNARVYFMRRFLHDFPTPSCVEILKNTVASMAPDSRVIICDMLVPDTVTVGYAKELYELDFALMCMNGKEKTLTEFHEIFAAAGLELVEIYRSGIGHTVMLETKLKAS